MKKIDFSSFKNYAIELENCDIYVEIQMMIKTKIQYYNVHVNIDNYLLTFRDKNGDEMQIDINYVANFYIDKELIKLELDSIGSIIIKKK